MSAEETDAAHQAQGPGNAEQPAAAAALQPSDLDKRLLLVVVHLLVAMVVTSMWGAADAWQEVSGLAIAGVLSVATAFLAGFVLGTLVHEWGHLAGARVAGARYTIPGKPGLFVFNFDFAQNSPQQFLTMSWGGQIGGVLAVVLLWLAVPLDTAGRAMLVSAAAGAAVFAAGIEWPVMRRVGTGGSPHEELARIDRDVLYGSALKGLGATALFWFVLG